MRKQICKNENFVIDMRSIQICFCTLYLPNQIYKTQITHSVYQPFSRVSPSSFTLFGHNTLKNVDLSTLASESIKPAISICIREDFSTKPKIYHLLNYYIPFPVCIIYNYFKVRVIHMRGELNIKFCFWSPSAFKHIN